ncbi:MAG: FAD-dependent thymidylate synthase, partial [Chloroflexi bacterium]|nr:FAD-dependent thymidylate synthase [Chloroflexota bacterium]
MAYPLRVYALPAREYPPEVIAVAFAKTSRSPEPFDVIAQEVSLAQSAAFHEKWVIGYGHASVAEHAVLHIAIENASRLALEVLESARLASFTEKSTRYQKWDPDAFLRPPELRGHALEARYEATARHLFATYQAIQGPVQQRMRQLYPPRPDEPPERWDRRVRTKYMDVCRFLLPAATLANVGMTSNARELAHTLRKMLAHPLAEVRQLAERIQAVAQHEAPTLVRYVTADRATQQALAQLTAALPRHAHQATRAEPGVRLLRWDSEDEIRVLAAALFRVGQWGYDEALAYVRGLAPAARQDLAQAMLAHLGRHDIPLRELEHAWYTAEVVLDQGAFYELKRHRMMTLTAQPLHTRLGYVLPRAIEEAGVAAQYHEAMRRAAQT